MSVSSVFRKGAIFIIKIDIGKGKTEMSHTAFMGEALRQKCELPRLSLKFYNDPKECAFNGKASL